MKPARSHRCERCERIYECKACTRVLRESLRKRKTNNNNYSTGGLYSRKCWHVVMLCPECEGNHEEKKLPVREKTFIV